MNNDMTEIIPHLFVSNWFTSSESSILNKYKIKGIITVEMLEKPIDILLYQKMNKIEHIHIRLQDYPSANIYQYFDMTYDFIRNKISKGENVLIHCYAGVSRSVTILLNYMIRTFYQNGNNDIKNSPREVFYKVLDFVKQKRPIVNPNQGFMNQLLKKTHEYSNEYFRYNNFG